MGMIKKTQDLVKGDQFTKGGTLYQVTDIVVGETIVGMTTTFLSEATRQTCTTCMVFDVDTEMYLPNADASPDLVDRSMTEPPPRPASTSRVDDFIREHTGKVEEIRSKPGHFPNTILP
jgi:hypothetical protein